MATKRTLRTRLPRASDLRAVRGEVHAAAYGWATSNTAAQNLAALQAAIVACLAATLGGHARVILPPGRFLVPPNIFSLLTSSIKFGLTISGAGRFSTVLKLVTGGAEAWFFNNGAGAPRLQAIMFEHLGFYGDDERYANGFKIYSAGSDKQFQFHDCEFGKDAASAWGETVSTSTPYAFVAGSCGMSTLLRTEGTANADLTTMSQCHVNLLGDFLYLNNAQSVAHTFLGVNGGIRGNLVYVGAAGGGYATFHGGSFDIYPDGTTTPRYVLNIPDSSGMGIGNGDFLFAGVKFELRDVYRGIYNLPSFSGHVQAKFEGCGFGTVVGGDRYAVKIAARKEVTFDHCVLHEDILYQFQSDTADSGIGSPQTSGILKLYDNNLGTSAEHISDRISKVGNLGRALGRGNFSTNSKDSLVRFAQDFDIGWEIGMPCDPAATVKVVPLIPSVVNFPNSGGPLTYQTVLPKDAFLVRIRVHKNSGGNSSSPYQLGVSNDDRTASWTAASTSAAQNVDHVIDITPNVVLSTLNDRTIEGYAVAGGTGGGAPKGYSGIWYI